MSAGSLAFIGRHRGAGLAAVAILAAGTWFLWPAVSSDAGDVAAIGDDTFAEVGPALGRELRDRGRGFEELVAVQDWCDLAATLPAADLAVGVDVLVIAVAERGNCADDPVAAVLGQLDQRDLEPVLVVYPGQQPPATDVRLVLTEQLLGVPGTTEMPCQWWDDCPPSGTVAVRSAAGDLTEAGADRTARMVAAVIG